jgi:hypothetical protein
LTKGALVFAGAWHNDELKRGLDELKRGLAPV